MFSRQEEHIARGGKIRSIILGLNDGLISTFTLLVSNFIRSLFLPNY
ncbi:MAG: hypothetical protein ACFFDB_11945 [Promethearchaeota archaeon]